MKKIYFIILSCLFASQISFGQVSNINFVLNPGTNVFTDSQTGKDFVYIPYQGFTKEQVHKAIVLSFLRHTNTNPKSIYEPDIENVVISHCTIHIPYQVIGTQEEIYNIQIKIENDKIKLYSPVVIKMNSGKFPVPYNYDLGQNKEGKFINKTEEKNYMIQIESINAILNRICNDTLRKD